MKRDFSANHRPVEPKHKLGLVEKSLLSAFSVPRILVADDDASTGEILRSLSEGQAYRVVSVRDGREAFQLLRRDADFSLAIFNLTMAHLRGPDIVRHMKTEKRLLRIPVIIVSGDDNITSVSDSFAAGALAFLPKPFGPDQLRWIVELALGAPHSSERVSQAA